MSMAWVSNLTMVYFNNILDLLRRRHRPSTIIWMFCTIAAFCVDDLVVIVSFLLPDFLDFFSACCNTFTARTDLSPLSPTRMFDTSLFTLIARIGFSHVSRILRTIKKTTSLPAVGTALPFMGPWVLSLAVFLHVHLFRVQMLTSWLTASLTPFSPVACCDRVHVSYSWHFSFEPILGFDSHASPALAGFFSPDCDFLVVIVPSHHFGAASCATSRLACSSSSVLW